MTLILELTSDQEARLNDKARALGVQPAEYVRRLLDTTPPTGLLPGESLLDGLRRIGVVGVAKGTQRSDGRAWSEVEGFE